MPGTRERVLGSNAVVEQASCGQLRIRYHEKVWHLGIQSQQSREMRRTLETIPRLLRSGHRALIAGTVVLATVYLVLTLLQTAGLQGDPNHHMMAMAKEQAERVRDVGATLSWGDLLRYGSSPSDGQAHLVARMHGKRVRMAGYMVPLDAAASKTTEFLLVPYYGACIHVPPPPPHQMVHVKVASSEGVPLNFEKPIWVEGAFRIGRSESQYGHAEYAVNAENVTLYENE